MYSLDAYQQQQQQCATLKITEIVIPAKVCHSKEMYV